MRMRRWVSAVIAISWAFLLATESFAVMSCDGTVDLFADFALNDHYEMTNTGETCFNIAGTNVDIDCKGKEIRCKNSSGCDIAIDVNGNNASIKNCYIVSETGDWNFGVGTYDGTFSYRDTAILKIVVENANVGVSGGESVKQSVFTGMGSSCISAGGLSILARAGMEIEDNFCESDGDGFVIKAPGTGNDVVVFHNYVRAADDGIVQIDGLVELTENIVDAPTPLDLGDSGDVTVDDNICDDNTNCEVPDDYPFNMNFTLNFR